MENKSIKKPEIVVFAGPNGSGKSTITNLLRPPMLPYINADEIQRVLDCDNMEAAKIAENRREECLEKCKGFCFETVLSTDRNLKLLKRAKDAGFFIRCYYVLTADPQINVARVASRVSAGGHDVPNLLKSQAPIKKSYRQKKSIAKQRRQNGSLGRLK